MHGGTRQNGRDESKPASVTPENSGVAGASPSRPDAGDVFPRVFLASRSPRRRELLTLYGIPHEAEHPGIDDSRLTPGDGGWMDRASVSADRHVVHGRRIGRWVAALAYLKAKAGYDLIRADGRVSSFRVVLGADTTCVRDGELLGTPTDADDARRIVRALSGGTHEVVTGVALIDAVDGSRRLFSDRAVVTVGGLTEEQVEEYVATEKWRGKAGAYNLHERVDAGWPIEYRGDATTITGLPMGKLARVLRGWGGVAAPR
jgi:septum formation protein